MRFPVATGVSWAAALFKLAGLAGNVVHLHAPLALIGQLPMPAQNKEQSYLSKQPGPTSSMTGKATRGIPAMAYRSLSHKRRILIIAVFLGFFIGLTVLLLQARRRDQATEKKLKKCQELIWLLETKNLITGHVLYQKSPGDEEQVRAIRAFPFQAKEKRILEQLVLTQHCPWEPDPDAVAEYRVELEHRCNASFHLILTKSNTPLGSYIVRDGDGKQLLVSRELLEMLPERPSFPFSKKKRCAVVGNSGILQNSRCGKEIDQADLIFRFNLPPVNSSEDVGTRTSLVTINPSIITNRFKGLHERRKPFVDTLLLYKDALFIIPSFSFASINEDGYRILYTMEDFGLVQRAFFLNPKYVGSLGRYWKREGLEVPRLSSGFIFTSVALEFCKHVTLYGFWPFSHDLNNRPIPHHYYDDRLPPPNMHDMPKEFSLFLELYAQGVLRLRLGRCQ